MTFCEEPTAEFCVAQVQGVELHQLANPGSERTWARTERGQEKVPRFSEHSMLNLELIIISAFG